MTGTQLAIQNTIEEIRQIDSVNRRVKETEQELSKANIVLDKLSKNMDDELADLEQMESMSVKAVFYKVLGSKEEQIEKERQEYLQASLKFNEQKDKIDLLEFELGILNKKLRSKDQLVKNLIELKRTRENEILNSNPEKADELLTISRTVDNNIMKQRSVSEAFTIGKKCLGTIQEIIGELKNAQHWGKWDMYGGGGRGTGRQAGYRKHSSIDRAKNLANIANHEIRKFVRELQESGEYVDGIQINIEGFSSFIDVFFDNLITDWIMQQKIVNSINMMHSNHDKIARILNSLKLRIDNLEKQNAQLRLDYDNILLS